VLAALEEQQVPRLARRRPLGAWFGYSSRLGERMMRLIDAFQALPLLILILALVALRHR